MENSEEIKILKVRPEHTEQVLRLLKESFIPREPLAIAIGYTWAELGSLFTSKVEKTSDVGYSFVDEGYSFVALNSSGRVVGCRLSTVIEIERDKVPEPDFIPLVGDSEKMNLLRSILRSLMVGWTKELPDCKTVLEFEVLCVEEQFGRRGIAESLVRRSLALAEELKVDYVYTLVTNWRSQRLFEKLNFTTLRTKNYAEFVDENGEPQLKMTDGSTCMKWMVKKMKK